VSRASWDSEHRDQILGRLEQPEMRAAALQGGFAKSDEEHWNLAMQSIRSLMGRIATFG
jgi:hypothetical protein